jgi:uncharacterized protein
MAHPDIVDALEELALIDHHVHGTLRIELDREAFEDVMTESDRPRRAGTTNFDSQFGLALRKYCAPLLDLEEFASPEDYVTRRLALGAQEVNHRLLGAARLGALIIDTGFATGQLTDLAQTAELSGAPTYEIVRREAVAEELVRHDVASGDFAEAVRRRLAEAVAGGAVGTKSIAAYRYGLDLPPQRPTEEEVVAAMDEWQRECALSGRVRITHPVLLSFLMWCGVDLARPLQIHIGYGDSDINMVRANPALLTDFLRASESSGAAVTLLHCYPYHREAAYLAQMFPHVFFDVGEAINYAGLQSEQVVREALEIGPFTKQLYSSDGWGPVELHYLGARLWRRAMARVLSAWLDDGGCSRADALRIARLIGRDNAEALYGVTARTRA